MKKIFSFAVVMAFGFAVSYAQTAVSAESATPVVKVTDVTGTAKCSSEGKSSACCSSAKAETSAAATTTEATTAAPATEVKAAACCSGHGSSASATTGANCKSVSMGTSAAKPEATKVEETPEK